MQKKNIESRREMPHLFKGWGEKKNSRKKSKKRGWVVKRTKGN